MYKNIEKQTALELREQVDYQAGQIISRTLVVSRAYFSFSMTSESMFRWRAASSRRTRA